MRLLRNGSDDSANETGNGARFDFPSSIAGDLVGNLYVADTYNNTIRKMMLVGTNWVVTTLGGMAGFYGTANGTGSAVRFGSPSGIAVDNGGTLYVADFYFSAIRKGYAPLVILKPRLHDGLFGFYLTGPPRQ